MPECAAAVAQCLRAGAGLRLTHQNYRRTDASPPPHAPFLDGAVGVGGGRVLSGKHAGLHVDTCFLPRHYATAPRQSYVLTLLAISPVVSGQPSGRGAIATSLSVFCFLYRQPLMAYSNTKPRLVDGGCGRRRGVPRGARLAWPWAVASFRQRSAYFAWRITNGIYYQAVSG